ncbi:hypothetical protein LOK49_LG08G00367 [Camellia lanceoleosa]|uniref:Uncharacterized protein n=1 Tax=Camellia lanceoleosa TaxID=1840588 RepID=A0ACC0GMM3_9ERIC|nr:hypothetical protein LOK49_LG08G00367 [Camellia lanceoleosa]
MGDEDGQFADNDPNSVFADARTIVMMKMTAEICQSRFERPGGVAGSSYYHNSKAKLDQLPLDVKAYDAWRVEIPGVNDDLNEKSIYNVASRTVGVRIQKAVNH